MITKSYSQSGQDKFVDRILEGKRSGIYLDIGCNHPIELSNTYVLEKELGWRGALIDRDKYCVDLCDKERKENICVWVDGLTTDWEIIIHAALASFGSPAREVIDYISLDCDENTAPILEQLLLALGDTRFRVMTVETDLYRFGPGPRDQIRGLLTKYNYDILCKDVRASTGEIYEEWCVDPKLVNMKVAEKIRSVGKKWSEVLG